MEEIFNRLKNQLEAKKPFAVYAKPGSNTLKAYFQNNSEPYTLEGTRQKGFIFAPFDTGGTAYIPESESEIMSCTIETDDRVSVPYGDIVISTADKAAYENLVTVCVSEIKAGRFNKLVASRSETVATGRDSTEIYRALLNEYPNAFRYCFYSPVSGLWMGATPEQLLKAENGIINTVALAGTQLFDGEKEAIWERKERDEQEFVTEYIMNQLAPFVRDVSLSDPYTFRAGNIVHIKTDITGQIKENKSVYDIITKLHPTPAVCGLPKEAARNFLLTHEGYKRKYYSGYLGELDMEGTADLFVNLRCMKMGKGTAKLFIGGGVTKDSDPEKEFYETVNKSKTMRKVL